MKTEYVTHDALVRIVTTVRDTTKFGIHVASFFPWQVQNPSKSERQGTLGHGVLAVSRSKVLAFLYGAYPAHYRSKVKIRLVRSDNWLFIGEQPS